MKKTKKQVTETTFQIKNETLNKIVVTDSAPDLEVAAGRYISCLMMVGIVKDDRKDVEWTGDNTFNVLTKGWNFSVTAI